MEISVESKHLFGDGEFDYDFLLEDDFLDTDSVGKKVAVTSAEPSTGHKAGVIKSVSSSDSILRMRRKIFRPRGGRVENNTAVNSIQCRAHLRRRNTNEVGKFKLYAFPTFDKCDSLLFLPTSIAALCNSGDMKTLSKVLHARASKNCKMNINVLTSDDLAIGAFVKMQEHIADAHPDVIVCVHNTRVVENQIHATMYVKFTASKILHSSMIKTTKDPVFRSLFSVDRTESLSQIIAREDIPEEERVQFRALINTDLDLIIHKRSEMVLTFDDTTKKLTRLSMKCRLTAIEVVHAPAVPNTYDETQEQK